MYKDNMRPLDNCGKKLITALISDNPIFFNELVKSIEEHSNNIIYLDT